MKDSRVVHGKWIRMSCAVGAVSVLSFTVGCDSNNGSDAASGGASSTSGGAPGSGGLGVGGSQTGPSGGTASGSASTGGGAGSGGTSSGGSAGAVGGQGGVPMNDPMCPSGQPTHEGTCFVNLLAVCSYEETNCVCSSGQWDCVGCPAEFVLALQDEDCSGYEGEACRTCQCPTGPEPQWDCQGSELGTMACGSDGLVSVSQSRSDGCFLLSLWTDLTDCVGDVSGDGYCVQRAQWIPGLPCDVPTSDPEVVWTARNVVGTIQVEGDEESPVVSLDLAIEYDPASAPNEEPPPNDLIQVDSCVADCSSQGCE